MSSRVTPTADRRTPADGSVSRPSKNNRHGPAQGGEPSVLPTDLPEDVPALRPVAVKPGTTLRDEAVRVEGEDGATLPRTAVMEVSEGDTLRSRPVYRVLEEFRDWYDGYESAHIEYESPDGDTVRSRLENSYQPEYAGRYYARLKDLERGIERRWEDVSTVMLTFTASHENAEGNARCPADHMREIAEGWRSARKMVHKALSGRTWEYARIWEPHADGYGHLHVAVFVEGDVAAAEFAPTMRSYVENVDAAGSDAHGLETAVSVNHDVSNLGSYLSEYLGAFGERVTERPISEQVFYAISWATNTRRLDFSNGAQEIISGERFRRETGLHPEDRGVALEGQGGSADGDVSGASGGGERQEGDTWGVDSICYVAAGKREYADPTTGGVQMSEIEGRPGMDPPPERA